MTLNGKMSEDKIFSVVRKNRLDSISSACTDNLYHIESIAKELGVEITDQLIDNVDKDVLDASAHMLIYSTLCPQPEMLNPIYLMEDLILRLGSDNEELSFLTKSQIKEAELEVHEKVYQNALKNLTKLEEDNRFYNWYKGFSVISLSYFEEKSGWENMILTTQPSGIIKTVHFGETFNPNFIDRQIIYKAYIMPPKALLKNPNFTLTIEIEKATLEGSRSVDDMLLSFGKSSEIKLNSSARMITQTLTPPQNLVIRNDVIINSEDLLANIDMKVMTGFLLKWSYNDNVDPWTIPLFNPVYPGISKYNNEYRR